MSDQTLNRFVASVADSTERLAFVPSPPTPASGPSSGYFLLQRDDNSSWSWDADAVAWVPVTSAGGALPATVQGDMLYASATNTIAALNKTSSRRSLTNTGTTNNPAWDGGQLLVASVGLTDANVKALPTTPFTLVAAQGSGTLISISKIILVSKFSAGAYTGIANFNYISATIGGVAGFTGFIADDSGNSLTKLTSFLGNTNQYTVLLPYFLADLASWGQVADPQAYASALNQPLQLMASAAGDFGGGNAANTLTAITYYTVETL